MSAVDTNVLVRFLTDDDPAQADRAEAALRRGSVMVPRTVLVETEWVLRGVYGHGRAAIASGLRQVLGLPGVVAEAPGIVARALRWYEAHGLDFADAMHLAASEGAGAFLTFDKTLIRRGRGLEGAVPVLEP